MLSSKQVIHKYIGHMTPTLPHTPAPVFCHTSTYTENSHIEMHSLFLARVHSYTRNGNIALHPLSFSSSRAKSRI